MISSLGLVRQRETSCVLDIRVLLYTGSVQFLSFLLTVFYINERGRITSSLATNCTGVDCVIWLSRCPFCHLVTSALKTASNIIWL